MQKGVKKAKGKTTEQVKTTIKKVEGMTESEAWKAVGQECLHPMSMFRRASSASGCFHTQAIAIMSAISSTFMAELNTNGKFFLPGFGTFHKKYTPGAAGKMMNVFGKWKAVAPVQAKTEIIFVPFDDIIGVLEIDGRRAGGVPSSAPAPSVLGSAPRGSRAPVTPRAALHPAPATPAAPEVNAAPEADDDKDGADSSSSLDALIDRIESGEPPAAAFFGTRYEYN